MRAENYCRVGRPTPYRGSFSPFVITPVSATPYQGNLTTTPTEAIPRAPRTEETRMSRRYVYARIDHIELSRRLDSMKMTAREMVRITGADERRALRWLDGSEDIPPHIDLITRMLERVPGASAEADAWVAERCRPNRPVTP